MKQRDSHDIRMIADRNQLVMEIVGEIQAAEISYVYLRGHEGLPDDIGNDVDILLPPGLTARVAGIFREVARKSGWSFIDARSYGSLCLFFGNRDSGETLHVDLFEEIAWHFIHYMDARGVLARRVWNGHVHIPDPQDSLYLYLCGRMIYQGVVREKHRALAREVVRCHGEGFVRAAFERHLGRRSEALVRDLQAADWQCDVRIRNTMRGLALRRHGVGRPWSLAMALGRYGGRTLLKMLNPPGRFFVLEGADGVGKSTVLEAVIPWASEWCVRGPYDFHWKPTKVYRGDRVNTGSVDPRGERVRCKGVSLCFLIYHISGFWWGWLSRIYPLLVRSHLIVGDRYSYDLFLDPTRFRLDLPAGLCRFAAMLAPRPDVTVGLVARPETIHDRKPELEVGDIAGYQARWELLSAGRRRMITVAADGEPAEVIRLVKRALLQAVTHD